MARSSWSPPPVPAEHGAWAMLLLPLVLGIELAGPRPSAAWLVPPAAILAFLAHNAVAPAAQRLLTGKTAPREWFRRRAIWGSLYFALSVVTFGAVVALVPGPSRSPLLLAALPAASGAAVYSVFAIAGARKRIGAELTGMASLALSAPITALASGGPVGARAAGATVVAFAYSVSALAFVRAYAHRNGSARVAAARCIAAHLLLAGGLVALVGCGWLSPGWLLAFVPVVVRTAWGLLGPPRNVRGVGFREIGVVVAVAAIASVLVLSGGEVVS